VGCKSYRGCHDMSLMSHKGVQQEAHRQVLKSKMRGVAQVYNSQMDKLRWEMGIGH